MNTAIVVVLSCLSGIIIGIAASTIGYRRTISVLRAKIRDLRRGTAPPGTRLETAVKMETMKKFVWFCEINGVAWVWCSYILAALDKMQIAEDLSKVALVEIIAPVVVYAAKSAIENLSKHNRWPDKGPENEEKPQEGDGEEPPPSG